MQAINFRFFFTISWLVLFSFQESAAQSEAYSTVQLHTDETYQTITGFGASLAYYENWLTAHPNRSEIYDVIFRELSLDILRIRNTHGYDAGMMERVREFALNAERSLGHPIDIMVTSWGPPAYLKSNNDKSNGGTLKYTVSDGKVLFDYAGFAQWWNESLNEYNANGIVPKYISIQNEPDWSAFYESCLLRPSEVVSASDTLAGYNKALDAVYDTLMQRDNPPLFLGPECIGIGYNAVENYIRALDRSKLYGIGHHLYHGAESGTVDGDPFTSANYKKVGNFYPEMPHFQTEYSRADWYSEAAMMFQSLAEENVTAYFYWDLIWSEGGLVNLHFPWNSSRWTNTKGYNRTKEYYVFKHYSAFIHPGWKRIGTSPVSEQVKSTAFISSTGDSAALVVINRSASDSAKIRLHIPGFKIKEGTAYSTTEETDFEVSDYLTDTLLHLAPRSLNTIDLRLVPVNTGIDNKALNNKQYSLEVSSAPNPFSISTRLFFASEKNEKYSLTVWDSTGKPVIKRELGYYPAGRNSFIFNRNGMTPGVYIYRLTNSTGQTGTGRWVISD